MNAKPISPKMHGLIDYALVGSLLTLPSILGLKKTVRNTYAAEGLALLIYVALTDHPVAVKPLIPFPVHGKIDPFNVGQFALQSFLKPFRKDKKTLLFNLGFTALAGITVLLTDWNGPTKTSK
ncbi:hypothetical protein HH214_08400 [Mucilaginibacter robiniae]|uniref:Uncharacterized protein n=1 Tax=Mucilaginibacter robiniae TaxID=2728022 RepID=A0A7L5DXQ2_9SPHI|nr:hypothetical protein [Mucilaginibacter robiniae]QJD95892.1 hypothetical protein HH214_08400 [Mucilaginibacter robiniae]